ncbi:hypothetical protein NIES2109_47440 [Nostoc sp. HK-01]|uniref:Uncharacterized protein n=1 Tax=Nostoc cycadae WK-1 TaxID=1861711 RepID=A0A2H6LJZ1_9NOSO|nr:hypothetical protein [Nostoc cycadae]BBD61908.1 hypothetical protein NIES2109_47440 [Nostoc sp. HK-01]GBE93513.1 hypothetical protein NCWK1_3276 [Nostoc cycadae WK-1]
MNKTLITSVIFAMLILLIVSPFAALASLMIVLLVSATFWFIKNLLQTIISGHVQSTEEGE